MDDVYIRTVTCMYSMYVCMYVCMYVRMYMAGGTTPATPAMAGPKFCKQGWNLNTLILASHQKLRDKRGLDFQDLATLKWISLVMIVALIQ